MAVIKRNLLCLRNKERLSVGEVILYELITDPSAVEFDPVSRIFDGLESVPEELKYYYESLLGVTSYYQHSQGGKGKYIEKRLASIAKTCSLNIRFSEFPLWLEHPVLHRKRGIFTLSALSSEEKRILRRVEWDYLSEQDEVIDIGNLLPAERAIVLIELKNRVDSGGTAARREIWTKKFRTLVELMLSSKGLFRRKKTRFSFRDLLAMYQYDRVELYFGILFNRKGQPATLDDDQMQGFYSASKEGFQTLIDFLKTFRKHFQFIEKDEEHLQLLGKAGDFYLRIGMLYGNQIPRKLFRKKASIAGLLVLRYDDMWLAQLLSIWERSFLLQYGQNYTTVFKHIMRKDETVRRHFDRLIEREGEVRILRKLVRYLLQHYPRKFLRKYCPPQWDRETYLGDVVQFVGAVEG